MISALTAAVILRASLLENLAVAAKARDVNACLAESSGLKESDFRFLKGQGAYGVGRFPWTVSEITDPTSGRTFVVFGTRITSQDIGESVFEVKNGRLIQAISETDAQGWKLADMEISTRFKPEEKKAMIEATMTLNRSAKPGPLMVRLSDHYRVKSVSSSRPLKFSQGSGVVVIESPNSVDSKVVLAYEGVVNQPGYAGAIVPEEVMLTNDYWWPLLARQAFPATIKIQTPSDWQAVSNGRQVSKLTKGQETVHTYRNDIPICYYSLSAGKFEIVERKVKGVNYRIWSRAMKRPDMELQTELFPPVIEWYSQFAPHPYDQYGAVVTDLYGSGALEAYSYATYGTGWLPDEDAHEPAHTWFGGLIPNTYLKSFWNESFAEFGDNLYRREGPIGRVADKRLAFSPRFLPNGAYNVASCYEGGASVGGAASALGYNKGHAILTQLEFEMGTDTIKTAIKKWIKDHRRGEVGEWGGFEAACGPKWKPFFDQWLRRTGWPKFTISDVKKVAGEAIGTVTFEGDPYRIETEAAIVAGGKTTIQRFTLNPTGKSQTSQFRFPIPAGAAQFTIDPYDRILTNKPNHIRRGLNQTRRFTAVPADEKELKPSLIYSDPSSPLTLELCRKAGVKLEAGKATLRGVTVDLAKGQVLALVPVEGGNALLRIGKTRRPASFGAAKSAIVDELGRFLAGETDPITSGGWTFSL